MASQSMLNNVISPSSSSVCSPDSDSESSESGDLCSAASTSNYCQDLQDELRCQPLEEHSGHEVQPTSNPQREDFHVIHSTGKRLNILFKHVKHNTEHATAIIYYLRIKMGYQNSSKNYPYALFATMTLFR